MSLRLAVGASRAGAEVDTITLRRKLRSVLTVGRPGLSLRERSEMLWSRVIVLTVWSFLGLGCTFAAETFFIEAEEFETSSAGWKATRNDQARRASRAATLWGADGPGDALATKTIRLREASRYTIWVRAIQVAAWRGPFRLSVGDGNKEIAAKVFDQEIDPKISDWDFGWHSFEAELPTGEVTLTFSKHEQKNCAGYVRHVDCVLLTTDRNLVPDHLPYGPQTFVRVTIGAGYERPVYLHLFADHYRDPWYAHYAIGRQGITAGLAPPADQLLKSHESSAWSNLTPAIYQDSGAALNFSIRYTYHQRADRFRAKLEFGRAETAQAALKEIDVIKTFDVEADPNGLVIIAPPDLESPANVALLQRDLDFAEDVGRKADAFAWPEYGRRPATIPMLVTANIGGYELAVDAAVTERERRTLDYFGFNGTGDRLLHGLPFMLNGSYCHPDLAKMRDHAKHSVEQFHKHGRRIEDIVGVMLMDEPTGQPASFASTDPDYRAGFREWIKKKGLTPQALLVESWDAVQPVSEKDRQRFPALHYYTQLFRTRALGDFLATQKRVLEEAYGRSWPTVANFSDGAVYHANFTGQGVDYFELLDSDDQNAIWGEDWANNSSTYQCAGYNVALMQAAARRRNQTIGHYLIAHAGRTPWDIKTKAVSETARGVRLWMNFCYGPNWGSHEGGPAWKSHLWHHKPELWAGNAEITREIGAVEDWLVTARPAPAETAILYSSASDIWTMDNYAYGFDRMHTWLALTHAQTPVDILSERDVADGLLQRGVQTNRNEKVNNAEVPFKVCYLSGPNLTLKAASELRAWVEAGGTLWLTAGAAERDEFNRALDTFQEILPCDREPTQTLDAYLSAGKFLNHLPARDVVTWGDEELEVLSVKQVLTPRESASVLAKYKDGSAAVVSSPAGKGRIIVCGFLPGLSYVKPALLARRPLEQMVEHENSLETNDQPEATNAANAVGRNREAAASGVSPVDREVLTRSHNPWKFPEGIRSKLLTPVHEAGIQSPVACNTPLVDLVTLPCEQGRLLALSNFSLRKIDKLEITVRNGGPVRSISSVRHGELDYTVDGKDVRFLLPLEATDFVKIR